MRIQESIVSDNRVPDIRIRSLSLIIKYSKLDLLQVMVGGKAELLAFLSDDLSGIPPAH